MRSTETDLTQYGLIKVAKFTQHGQCCIYPRLRRIFGAFCPFARLASLQVMYYFAGERRRDKSELQRKHQLDDYDGQQQFRVAKAHCGKQNFVGVVAEKAHCRLRNELHTAAKQHKHRHYRKHYNMGNKRNAKTFAVQNDGYCYVDNKYTARNVILPDLPPLVILGKSMALKTLLFVRGKHCVRQLTRTNTLPWQANKPTPRPQPQRLLHR